MASVPGLYELAVNQLGVVSRGQLIELGVTRHHVRRQLAAQRWQTAGPRVVVLMTGPLTDEQWLWAAQLHAGHEAGLYARTALGVLGLRGWDSDALEVAVPHAVRAVSWGRVRVHRLRRLSGADITVRSGLRCVAAPRSALDAASAHPSARTAAALVLAVVQQRVTPVEELGAALDSSPHRRHASVIRRALADAAEGADSVAEVDVVTLLQRAGLTRIRRQAVIRTSVGPRRVDIAVDLPDGSVLVVEVDGPHHADPSVRATDAEKDASVIAAGNRVLRIPVVMVRTQPERVLANLRAIAVAGCQSAS